MSLHELRAIAYNLKEQLSLMAKYMRYPTLEQRQSMFGQAKSIHDALEALTEYASDEHNRAELENALRCMEIAEKEELQRRLEAAEKKLITIYSHTGMK